MINLLIGLTLTGTIQYDSGAALEEWLEATHPCAVANYDVRHFCHASAKQRPELLRQMYRRYSDWKLLDQIRRKAHQTGHLR